MRDGGDAVYRSPGGAGHLNKIKYTRALICMQIPVGCSALNKNIKLKPVTVV